MSHTISLDTILSFLVDSVPSKALPDADAVFVFGHYAPEVARHAASLWLDGNAPFVVVSGKGRDKIPAGYDAEADFYAEIIRACGVPDDAIILEREATNTLENVRFGMRRCEELGLSPSSLTLCAMPPLLRRARATFQGQFPGLVTHGSAFPGPSPWSEGHIIRLLGEFDRLRSYAEKGDIAPVSIPTEVLEAVHALQNENRRL